MNMERVESDGQIAAVAALARETWVPHYVPIIGAAQVEYMLEKFQSAEAIARQIASEGYEYFWAPGAGYLALVPETAAGRVLLSKIYVKADRRGTGLGKAMLEFAEARCAELGCRELWLTVNKDNAGSIAFYERMGFGKTNRMTTGIGGGYVMDDWRDGKGHHAGGRSGRLRSRKASRQG
jgi:diamine N-acetyltransferase